MAFAHQLHLLPYRLQTTMTSQNELHRPEQRSWYTYPSAGLVVVQVHQSGSGFSVFSGIDEVLAEALAEAYILGAAAPLPVAAWLPIPDPVVAAALCNLAPVARPRDAVRHSSCRDRVDVRRLWTL